MQPETERTFHSNHIGYQQFVQISNDFRGIESRGGCSCAGTYDPFI
ncbi:hypothetical protein [Bacillus rhizoplanae]